MTFFHLLAISFALAVDAFAVALAAGIRMPRLGSKDVLRLAWHFGFFQAGMAGLGWSFGLGLREWVQPWDHWLAFGLLLLVGLNMIRCGLSGEEEVGDMVDPTRGLSLVLLSVATSIDALAVGFSFSVLEVAALFPLLVIGSVAFLMTALGMYWGHRMAKSFGIGAWAEVLGGLVLMGIGLRILHEHTDLTQKIMQFFS
ncbi:manganese efflux pump MntP family protein [Desulfobotulus sp. H1]|uniref:Putative manganese efflux pump MntP n=1 Tax=Desulfobotulus pelophilus TaxID=2823377 RepID=A0ABT3NAZ0_9BACT|nr:manganese efflux pump MntP family protein [Desulfobotulus pelophilus]MCW7754623.1 manganese efflux pump MntP family protein [Desulfobotulus pelophilus]